MRFKVVIPSYNCLQWLPRCLDSIDAQRDADYDVCVIDDASTERGQREFIQDYCSRRGWDSIIREQNVGALQNIKDGIEKLQPNDDDVIVVVDGDDWLAHRKVFRRLSQIYQAEPVTMTYGGELQYVSVQRPPHCVAVPEHLIDERRQRSIQWPYNHLRSFKYWLWRQVKEDDLIDPETQEYYCPQDVAWLYPMAEMAAHSVKHIDEHLYIYNNINPINDVKVKGQIVYDKHYEIQKKPPYEAVVTARCRPSVHSWRSRLRDQRIRVTYQLEQLERRIHKLPGKLLSLAQRG